MYVDFMLFTVIALATGVIILLRILSSNMRYQEKGFLRLIILAVCHNLIDIFWGLTYYSKLHIEGDTRTKRKQQRPNLWLMFFSLNPSYTVCTMDFLSLENAGHETVSGKDSLPAACRPQGWTLPTAFCPLRQCGA